MPDLDARLIGVLVGSVISMTGIVVIVVRYYLKKNKK